MVKKNPKISKTLKKSLFLFLFFWGGGGFPRLKKKCYPLSFSIIGGRNSTRALQSGPFQNYKIFEKSLKKITFFQQKKTEQKKKW